MLEHINGLSFIGRFFLSLYCWTVIAVLTVVLGIFTVLSSFISPAVSLNIAKVWGRLILKICGIKVRVIINPATSNFKKNSGISKTLGVKGAQGAGVYPENSKSYIITSNHQSYFDIFVLLACLSIDFRFVAKKSLFKIPFLGQSMKRLGYIPIDRENLRSALKSVKAGAELLKNKTSVLIFPEGTRSLDGKLLSFKKGGLNMFLKQDNISVLPVAIKGTVNILRKNSLTIHPGKTVELHILQPIEVSEKNKGLMSGKEDGIIKTIEDEIRAALEFK